MDLRGKFQKVYKYFRELGRLTPLAIVTAFLPIAGSTLLLIFAFPIGHWLRENWELGAVIYLAGILVFCGLSLLPTNVIGIVGGWSFGFPMGIAVLMLGVVGSALISFFIHRRIVRDQLPEFSTKHPKAQAIYAALLQKDNRRTTLVIFLLRASVITPFALTNFLLAAAKVPVSSFVAGTFLGMLPRSTAMVFLGAGLSELTFGSRQYSWLLVFGAAATIITVIFVARISKRALDRLAAGDTPLRSPADTAIRAGETASAKRANH